MNGLAGRSAALDAVTAFLAARAVLAFPLLLLALYVAPHARRRRLRRVAIRAGSRSRASPSAGSWPP